MRVTVSTIAAAVLAAGALAGGGSATPTAVPQWQTVPGAKADDHLLVWASGRIWVLNNGTGSGRLAIRSARVSGTRLAAWATAQPSGAVLSYEAALGQSLVFRPPSQGGAPQAVKLLPSGMLAPPTDLGGTPPAQTSSGSPVVQLRDRPVQLTGTNSGVVPHLAACCDTAGALVSFASFIRTWSYGTLGVDRHGRLWLAWAPVQSPRAYAAIVQLDPSTLEPRGAPARAPGITFARIVDLACADTCRLVIEGLRRPNREPDWSWAPGEASATPIHIAAGAPNALGRVVAARLVEGRLVVAFSASDPRAGVAVGLARGDARGAGMRVLSTLPIPQQIGAGADAPTLTVGPFGAFGPNGFAAVTVHEVLSSSKATVRVAILRL